MTFKSSNSKYTNRFVGQLMRFIEEYRLFGKEERLLIAVSGGIDSMALLYAISKIQSYGYSNQLRVVHVNHGSRVGQDSEERFVKEYCAHLGVECLSQTLTDLDPHRNFEYKARLKRYEVFYDFAFEDEKILLAHHIDDSFEWTFLQGLRSSSIEGLIGVPVVNGRVIRPFMCVTKEQIKRFAGYLDLPFIEDPTNEQIKYERNFIRNEVVGTFKDRHKKYLKHYVYRHNEIARRLGVHYLNKQKSQFKMSKGSGSVLIYSMFSGSDYSGLEDLLLKGLKHLLPDSRGSVAKQLENVVTAMKNNKYGPLSLTSGIQVYMDHNLVLMTKHDEGVLEFKYPEHMKFSFDEFSNFLQDIIPDKRNHFDFPFLVSVKSTYLDKRNFNTSFNKSAVESLRQKGDKYYPALKLLREWSKKKNRHKVLRLNFLTSV